ncbi:MAG: Holliday junction branch migration protein RuvA [Coriobacteriia bacterium]|nr:Holliday junction branch migration protein RuvA [Coriobacteriia bacterium]
MIAYLTGTVAGTDQTTAVIDVNGVGYAVFMSSRALSRLPHAGEQTRVFTYLQVREDDMSLYGFLTLEEKDLFQRLIGVTGVGPKVALAALSTFEPDELVEAIVAEDVKAVSRIPGVGKKSASRIVLELKGSLDSGFGQAAAPSRENANIKLAAETLMAMGFSPTEAEVALRDAPEDVTEAALVKYALKQIGS